MKETKIGILTHYDVNNLGAQLQMYMLYNKIKEMGYFPYILTYEKNFDFSHEEKLKNRVSVRSIPYYLKNYLFKKGLKLTLFNIVKYIKNKTFREKYFRFKYYTDQDIDIVIIGSDEVFSIPVGINIMMYGHGLSTDRIIAYAPSFGQTTIDLIKKHNCTNIVASGLRSFKSISARDNYSANMIKYFTQSDVGIVCDPVMFYNNHDGNKTIVKHKYLLLYSMDRWMSEQVDINNIREVARHFGLKVYSVGTYHGWCDKNIACNCLEWIDYFKNAEAVITDTFHGLLMCIRLNKRFAVFVRDLNTNKLEDLIGRFGLYENRIYEITVDCIIEALSKKIDYETINCKMESFVNDSERYLHESIELCNNDN